VRRQTLKTRDNFKGLSKAILRVLIHILRSRAAVTTTMWLGRAGWESKMYDRMLVGCDEGRKLATSVSPLILSGSVMSVGPAASRRKMLPLMAVCTTVYLTAASASYWIAGLMSRAV
jgi:hypothetical protein